jgi:DNA polymerase (family 10)
MSSHDSQKRNGDDNAPLASAVQKSDVLAALRQMAALLELDGANTFKVRAFENAARTLEANDIDPATVVADGSVDSIKGIGASIAAFIRELVETGNVRELAELSRRIPAGLLRMLDIPGFGPKKARAVWQERGITTINHLAHEAQEGTLADLRGFGAKTCQKILEGIRFLESGSGRFRINTAWEAAEELIEFLAGVPEVERIEAAGSLRRMKETVHDIDLVAMVADEAAAKQVMAAFVGHPAVEAVLGHGATKSSVRLASTMQADLRCVTPEQFPHTLQHFTGSKEHNVRLRQRAKDRGLRMNEYGLFRLAESEAASLDAEKVDPSTIGARIACADEAGVYGALGLAWIPPELREDMGEWAAAERGEVPRLVERGDLRGILHNHSTWSDGRASIRAMAEACRALGVEFFGIADHSQVAAYAGGLQPDRVRRQWDEIDALNAAFADAPADDPMHGFRILKGIEADILPDGTLDYAKDGDLLDGFEYVVGSVHSSFSLSEREQTDRVLRAMDDPRLTILGHATGRLLLRRDGFAIRLEEVLEKAAANRIAVEVNASPYRLDLDWRWGRRAVELGVKTAINPDAHVPAGLADIRYGLGIARKAGWAPKDVLSCWSADEVVAFARARRG